MGMIVWVWGYDYECMNMSHADKPHWGATLAFHVGEPLWLAHMVSQAGKRRWRAMLASHADVPCWQATLRSHAEEPCWVGRAEKPKTLNINLNQVGSNGTHKNKTYLSKEKNSKVHIRIGKCIWNTPGTAGGPRGRDQTLAVKIARQSVFFSRKKIKIT